MRFYYKRTYVSNDAYLLISNAISEQAFIQYLKKLNGFDTNTGTTNTYVPTTCVKRLFGCLPKSTTQWRM